MEAFLDTISESVQDLIASGIKILPGLIGALFILILTKILATAAQNFATRIGKRTVKSRSLQLLIAKAGYTAAWIVGGLLAGVLAFPGLELGDIIATLGLGSVAIGFAFQDIFKNLFAGVLLLFQEPFSIGDEIVVDTFQGTVENIDIRTTQIKTYQGEKVLIPNSTVFTNAVTIRTAYPVRRTDLAVGVDYNTPLSEVSDILFDVISSIDGVNTVPKPEIDLVNFGESSIDLMLRYWTNPEQKEVRRIQTSAILSIKRAFDRHGIVIPYPIRTVYRYDQETFNDYKMIQN